VRLEAKQLAVGGDVHDDREVVFDLAGWLTENIV
jgi:hypothetical protein